MGFYAAWVVAAVMWAFLVGGERLTGGEAIGKDVDCCGCCERPKTLFEWAVCGGAEEEEENGEEEEDEPIATDRPDFTETSSTVGLGRLQVELGWTRSEDDDGGIRTRSDSYPETLVRVGMLAEWFEFRVAYNYTDETMRSAGLTSRTSGSEDLYLGVKLALTEQKGVLPEMALTPQMTVPTGSNAFTADEVLPGVNWLYGWDITEWLSTAGSTQFNRAIDDGTGDAYYEFAQSWTFGVSITERLGAYAEWFAFVPTSADTMRTEHYFNGGPTYQITDDWQIDFRAGVGLNEAADDWFLGTGMGVRF
jgi:hypothetical protein